MKKVILFIVIILCSAQIYSAEPLIKFYLQDGSTKQYNLSDIDSMNIIDKKNNYVMRIHYQDTLVAFYPTEIIGSIKFQKDSATRDILNVYIFSYPKSYVLSSIDSVIFYIDQYQPLTIGSQVWMLKNLNVDHYRNGDSIPEVKDSLEWANLKTGAWCYFNNDTKLGLIYAKLYNWYAVNDPRGIAPTGWHVPTDGEWTELEMCLGMLQSDADNTGWRGPNQGGKLKSTGTKEAGDGLWLNPNTGATNDSGFSALPGGIRSYRGTFFYIGYGGLWWSSTVFDTAFAWHRYMYYYRDDINRFYDGKAVGYSVRCVKGDIIPQTPKIDSISPSKAFAGEDVILYGSNFGSIQGSSKVLFTGAVAILYPSWTDTQIKVKVPVGATKGKVTVTVYSIKSNEIDFTSLSSDTLCTQKWSKRNLEVTTYHNGDPIPEVRDSASWANLTTGAWCYFNNDPALGAIYGKLYNWYAVNDPRGLAPEGWHVPTYEEWKELETCLGGSRVAGNRIKSTGTKQAGDGFWLYANKGVTNSSGFSAHPGGRRYSNGLFNNIGYYGFWWAYTEYNASNAWLRYLSCSNPDMEIYNFGKGSGFSVRCVKD